MQKWLVLLPLAAIVLAAVQAVRNPGGLVTLRRSLLADEPLPLGSVWLVQTLGILGTIMGIWLWLGTDAGGWGLLFAGVFFSVSLLLQLSRSGRLHWPTGRHLVVRGQGVILIAMAMSMERLGQPLRIMQAALVIIGLSFLAFPRWGQAMMIGQRSVAHEVRDIRVAGYLVLGALLAIGVWWVLSSWLR